MTLLEQTDYIVQSADALVVLAQVSDAAGEGGSAVEAAQAALDLYERKGHLVGAATARGMLEVYGAAV